MRTYRFIVGPADAGARLDRYLATRLPSTVSRSMIQRGIRDGGIALRDRLAKAHQKVQPGDVIEARLSSLPARAGDAPLTPQPIPLEIVYEDAHLLVVNKPAGLVTHPAPGHWDGTLVNAILWHLQQAEGSRVQGQGVTLHPPPSTLHLSLPRAGIVHRLDKDTSGLLVVAKTDVAHAALSKQLEARAVQRRYLALVEGWLPMDQGTVNVPIGRHLTHRKSMTVRHLGGRSAVTHFRVLNRVDGEGSRVKGQGVRQGTGDRGQEDMSHVSCLLSHFRYTVLEARLETGRTHQIRVHLLHLGHPVLGDTAYGRHPAAYWSALGITRQLLHAYAIRFVHPVTRRSVELRAPLPADIVRWIPHGGSCLHFPP
ncbi:MAG: RluA family pseudouridine synthase [Candidatus Omnitrophota bacterium]|nr:RluA family pseudouridine synthase [Candidatus Omnitrophota bacterium]